MLVEYDKTTNEWSISGVECTEKNRFQIFFSVWTSVQLVIAFAFELVKMIMITIRQARACTHTSTNDD